MIALSPALASDSTPSYELKFLTDDATARKVIERASDWICPDPHGDEGRYRITTLYLDTLERDVLHRSVGFRRTKFRIRRYESEDLVYLETKRKRGDRVAKVRSAVSVSEIGFLAEMLVDADWAGSAFGQRIRDKRLFPAAAIGYDRQAFVALDGASRARLTLDRSIAGIAVDRWCVPHSIDAAPILAGQVILELKFAGLLPGPFRRLIAECGLMPTRLSKYRAVMGGSSLA